MSGERRRAVCWEWVPVFITEYSGWRRPAGFAGIDSGRQEGRGSQPSGQTATREVFKKRTPAHVARLDTRQARRDR